jgi:hypothetical protein
MASDHDLLAVTRRTSTLVMTLRQTARVSACVDVSVVNDLTALELELAALVHEVQMGEVRKWLDVPIRGRVTNPPMLSTEVRHGVPIDRLDSITDTMTTSAIPRSRPAPAISGMWGRRGRRSLRCA